MFRFGVIQKKPVTLHESTVYTNSRIFFKISEYVIANSGDNTASYRDDELNLLAIDCKTLSIKIQHLYSSISINQDTTSVFVSIYQSSYNLCIPPYLSIEIQPMYSSVSINQDTISVFLSIYQSRYNLCIPQYLSIELQPLF